MPANRLPWVWDCEIDELELRALLAGERTIGRLDFLVAWLPEHHPELVTAPWMSGTGWS